MMNGIFHIYPNSSVARGGAAGGSAPRPPKQPPHCEFLATRLYQNYRRRQMKEKKNSPNLAIYSKLVAN